MVYSNTSQSKKMKLIKIIKNIKTHQYVDVLKIPTLGIHLIEASAGTGKTFTIIVLYLKLLLGIGETDKNQKKFLVNEILVVTFTNTAKKELHKRIIQSIENLYLSCIDKKHDDACANLLIKEITNRKEAIEILQKAKNDMYKSSIYTIHGFCQKMLKLHTLYFNFYLDDNIVESEDHLQLQAVEDFWRQNFYNLPQEIVDIIFSEYKNPYCLLQSLRPFLHLKNVIFQPKFKKYETLITYHEKIIQKINNFKKLWIQYKNNILEIIVYYKKHKKNSKYVYFSRWINEITIWSNTETKNYYIPVVLKKFQKNYFTELKKDSVFFSIPIFNQIEKIINEKFSLRNIIIFYALKKIPKLLLKEKHQKSLLSFNDLMGIFFKFLKKEPFLKDTITNQYPVAFIDEFQDTDIEQYKIFNYIYNKKNKNTGLFLIGDPKQAIYSFRGADIFSYLYAKSKIKNHYYLNINWRSSMKICQNINLLFSQFQKSFLLENIPYLPIISAEKNKSLNFQIKGKHQPALNFFFQKKEKVNIHEYQEWISTQCANEISFWLNSSKKGEAIITDQHGEKKLKINDIAILVRNKIEANIIQKSLKKMNIPSTYSSNKKNVFHTLEAKELLKILKSILYPDDSNLLYQSIFTDLCFKLIHTFKSRSQKEKIYFLVKKLYKYHNIWKRQGILNTIKLIIIDCEKNTKFTDNSLDYRKNTKYLYIAELLEEKSVSFFSKHYLLHWFQKKILQKTPFECDENTAYFNKLNSIQILTIHKAKGLEYPIVWIPFGIDFHEKKYCIYHNEKTLKFFFDTENNKKSLMQAEKERLSEDVRLLYVALTRTMIHCSLGIACLIKNKKKNNVHSDIHKSALGYIIQHGRMMNYHKLLDTLKKLCIYNDIKIYQNISGKQLLINEKKENYISKKIIHYKKISNIWKITSFTQLNQKNLMLINLSNVEKIITPILIKKNNKNLTIHNFPRGKKTGLFLHEILKKINFVKKKDNFWFTKILNKHHFSSKWSEILNKWIQNIIHAQLSHIKISLSQLNTNEYIKEFEFFLPIKNILNSTKLNQLIKSFDPISSISPNINFDPVTGILRGFIDLIFFWNQKYYIIDYKSNWLGENNCSYSQNNITQEIIKKRYDIQYQIYTLAVHQYLKNKIKNYRYTKNFGGIFYIFLRAVEKNTQNNGIFYTVVDDSLVKKLLNLLVKSK